MQNLNLRTVIIISLYIIKVKTLFFFVFLFSTTKMPLTLKEEWVNIPTNTGRESP